MNRRIIELAERFILQQKHRVRLLRSFTALALVVAICTTYVLVQPGLTMEAQTYCGLEEHVHTEDCYVDTLICGLEEREPSIVVTKVMDCSFEPHVHTSECYNSAGERVCGFYGEYYHVHDGYCYDDAGNLICGLKQNPPHNHTSSCFTWVEGWRCGLEENPGHVHTDACYARSTEPTCGLEESEGHHHDAVCTRIEKVLTCQEPERIATGTDLGHTHTEDCYTEIVTYECGLEEGAFAHHHTDACYPLTDELICGLNEGDGAHTHTNACRTMVRGEFICTKAPNPDLVHKHSSSCFDSRSGYCICGKIEILSHQHSERCVRIVEAVDEGHHHTAACYHREYICGKEEHQHTAECFVDPNPTPELTPAVTETPTVPVTEAPTATVTAATDVPATEAPTETPDVTLTPTAPPLPTEAVTEKPTESLETDPTPELTMVPTIAPAPTPTAEPTLDPGLDFEIELDPKTLAPQITPAPTSTPDLDWSQLEPLDKDALTNRAIPWTFTDLRTSNGYTQDGAYYYKANFKFKVGFTAALASAGLQESYWGWMPWLKKTGPGTPIVTDDVDFVIPFTALKPVKDANGEIVNYESNWFNGTATGYNGTAFQFKYHLNPTFDENGEIVSVKPTMEIKFMEQYLREIWYRNYNSGVISGSMNLNAYFSKETSGWGDAGDNKIEFGGEANPDSVIIQQPSDESIFASIGVDKSRMSIDLANGTLTYTADIASTMGTNGKPVNVKDVLTVDANGPLADVMKMKQEIPEISVIDLTTTKTAVTPTNTAYDGTTLSYTLPAMEENGHYQVVYTYKFDPITSIHKDGQQKFNNTIDVTSGDKETFDFTHATDSEENWDTHTRVTKSGSHNTLTNEATWRITVNEGGVNIVGKTLKDSRLGLILYDNGKPKADAKMTITMVHTHSAHCYGADGTLTCKLVNGNNTVDPSTLNWTKGEDGSGSVVFPGYNSQGDPDSNGQNTNKYIIQYSTKPTDKESTETGKMINEAEFDGGKSKVEFDIPKTTPTPSPTPDPTPSPTPAPNIDKTGVWNKDESITDREVPKSVTWTLTINSNNADLAGKVLQDNRMASLIGDDCKFKEEANVSITATHSHSWLCNDGNGCTLPTTRTVTEQDYTINPDKTITFNALENGMNLYTYVMKYTLDLTSTELGNAWASNSAGIGGNWDTGSVGFPMATPAPDQKPTPTPEPTPHFTKAGNFTIEQQETKWTLTINEAHANIADITLTDSMLGRVIDSEGKFLSSAKVTVVREHKHTDYCYEMSAEGVHGNLTCGLEEKQETFDLTQDTSAYFTLGKGEGTSGTIKFPANMVHAEKGNMNTDKYVITYYTTPTEEELAKGKMENEAKFSGQSTIAVVPVQTPTPPPPQVEKSFLEANRDPYNEYGHILTWITTYKFNGPITAGSYFYDYASNTWGNPEIGTDPKHFMTKDQAFALADQIMNNLEYQRLAPAEPSIQIRTSGYNNNGAVYYTGKQEEKDAVPDDACFVGVYIEFIKDYNEITADNPVILSLQYQTTVDESKNDISSRLKNRAGIGNIETEAIYQSEYRKVKKEFGGSSNANFKPVNNVYEYDYEHRGDTDTTEFYWKITVQGSPEGAKKDEVSDSLVITDIIPLELRENLTRLSVSGVGHIQNLSFEMENGEYILDSEGKCKLIATTGSWCLGELDDSSYYNPATGELRIQYNQVRKGHGFFDSEGGYAATLGLEVYFTIAPLLEDMRPGETLKINVDNTATTQRIINGKSSFYGEDTVDEDLDVKIKPDELKLNKEQIVHGAKEDSNRTLTYTVDINRRNADADPNSNTITLSDTLTYERYHLITQGNLLITRAVSIDRQSIKLYRAQVDDIGEAILDENGKLIKGAPLEPSLWSTIIKQTSEAYNGYDDGKQSITMTITVPDSMAIVLEYDVTETVNDTSVDGIPLSLSNTVTFKGEVSDSTETSNEDIIGASSGSGHIPQTYLELIKTDAVNTNITLPGAVFTLYEYNGTEYVSTNKTFETDKNGELNVIMYVDDMYSEDFDESLISYRFKEGVSYVLRETKAPVGYELDPNQVIYFYVEKLYQDLKEVGGTAPEFFNRFPKEPAKEDHIRFTYDMSREETVTNERVRTHVQVKKTWQDKNGGTLNEVDGVTIPDGVTVVLNRLKVPVTEFEADENGKYRYEYTQKDINGWLLEGRFGDDFSATAVLNRTNGWQASWRNLIREIYDTEGNLTHFYVYYVVERDVDGFASDMEFVYNGDGEFSFSLTNVPNGSENGHITMKVAKKWSPENAVDDAPDFVQINVYRSSWIYNAETGEWTPDTSTGEVLVEKFYLNKNSDWYKTKEYQTWTKIDDVYTTAYTYRLEEVPVEGFIAEYHQPPQTPDGYNDEKNLELTTDSNQVFVTNKQIGSEISLYKTWDNVSESNKDNLPRYVYFQLLRNGEPVVFTGNETMEGSNAGITADKKYVWMGPFKLGGQGETSTVTADLYLTNLGLSNGEFTWQEVGWSLSDKDGMADTAPDTPEKTFEQNGDEALFELDSLTDENLVFTATNRLKNRETGLMVKKLWQDATGEALPIEDKPDINLSLYRKATIREDAAEGTPEKDDELLSDYPITLTKDNQFQMNLTGLPIEDDNYFYSYYVVEDSVPEGYKAAYKLGDETTWHEVASEAQTAVGVATDQTLMVSNTLDKVDITLTKTWKNAENVNTAPTTAMTVKLQLIKRGTDETGDQLVKLSDTTTLEASANVSVSVDADNGFINLTGGKNEGAVWTLTVKDLEPGDYYFKEVEMKGFVASNGGESQTGENGQTLTNTPTSLKVTKKYFDVAGNEITNIPKGTVIKFRVYYHKYTMNNGELTLADSQNEQVLSAIYALSSENGWTIDVTNLPLYWYENGTTGMYKYYVQEGTMVNGNFVVNQGAQYTLDGEPVEGTWGATLGTTAPHIVIRNTLTSVKVQKAWKLSGFESLALPHVTLTLKRIAWPNTEPPTYEDLSKPEYASLVDSEFRKDIVLNASDVPANATSMIWETTVDNLDAFDKAGNPYYYFLVEENVPAGFMLATDALQSNPTRGGSDATLTITNEVITYELPETGGPGTYMYTITGLLLMLAALVLLYRVNMGKKQRGEGCRFTSCAS